MDPPDLYVREIRFRGYYAQGFWLGFVDATGLCTVQQTEIEDAHQERDDRNRHLPNDDAVTEDGRSTGPLLAALVRVWRPQSQTYWGGP
jgi:hypothetical protein